MTAAVESTTPSAVIDRVSLVLDAFDGPGFLAALVWRGMLNREFGYINQVLLGGTNIPAASAAQASTRKLLANSMSSCTISDSCRRVADSRRVGIERRRKWPWK